MKSILIRWIHIKPCLGDLATKNDRSVADIYVNNLKQDMKNKLQEKGYVIQDININIAFEDSSNYGKIQSINLRLYFNEQKNRTTGVNTISINKIEDINIDNNINSKEKNSSGNKNLSMTQINEVKDYLSNIYDVKKKNININE